MAKTRLTLELVAKAKKVFEESKTKTIRTGDGLSRKELRMLERRGFVTKLEVFGKRKFADRKPTISYVWEWKE
jgi:hypothetical protein